MLSNRLAISDFVLENLIERRLASIARLEKAIVR